MSGPARPPAPRCADDGCAADAKWSTRSRRYLKYCGDEHARASSRGTCKKGLHPRPPPGERCQGCKADWRASNNPQRRRRPAGSARPIAAAAPALPTAVVDHPMGIWRPAGIELCPARGGPDDPRWTVA